MIGDKSDHSEREENGESVHDGDDKRSLDAAKDEQEPRTPPPAYRHLERAPSYATQDTTADQTFKREEVTSSQSTSAGFASAARINAVMGPPPPKEEKKTSRWKRWQQDRQEMRELGAPKHDSDKTWKCRGDTG
ncbi:unnamed protein product [Zymoseptoria tritici ST99CH_3D7]|uniref:Uncharacterized protein n=1 Tax=Zymoseptoria tritici (strain ST99CH_3D7) TaxID=1276538 RepID=A0A1X7RK48_ZYMT9|nr:unnamed protein product [Zymoseptoria tritici ST99CH_3D7]